MQKIDKVIIYRENDLIYSFAYSKEKLYFTVLDKVDDLYSESILPIKITKLNKASHSAFLEYGNKQTGYINLPKWLKTQDG
ncbi:MAG: hypothetical protein PHC75_09135, partial [Burkholderiales bacterium]|nr:hypothetical protein [Burkholderiales bacterium]